MMKTVRLISMFAFLLSAGLGCAALPEDELAPSDIETSEQELRSWGNCWIDESNERFCCLYGGASPCYACSTGDNSCGW